MIAINLGCGKNRLPGWQNYDADVNIACGLPWNDGVADFVLAEHVVEHVEYRDAVNFFRECHRVLRPGGVARIAVPSIERIMNLGTQAYFDFVYRWAPPGENTRRGAMHAILNAHGHRAAWTESMLVASVYFAGFDRVETRTPGHSHHEELRGVEGHGRVIGDEFNEIETVVVEGIK